MGTGRDLRREAYVGKAGAELETLHARGVTMAGNAFASVLLLKGETDEGALLSGRDGDALRAALAKLGYAPEDWSALATYGQDGDQLPPELVREAICVLDPSTVIVLDELAASSTREAYASELSGLDDFDCAMLTPGRIARILGMRFLNLDGFAASLGNSHQKQVRWAWIKQLPPLLEPY